MRPLSWIWDDVDRKSGIHVDGYPIECDWCGEATVVGQLVRDDEDVFELWETCETCSVRTRIGPVQ